MQKEVWTKGLEPEPGQGEHPPAKQMANQSSHGPSRHRSPQGWDHTHSCKVTKLQHPCVNSCFACGPSTVMGFAEFICDGSVPLIYTAPQSQLIVAHQLSALKACP